MNKDFYSTNEYRKLQSEKTRLAWQLGLHDGIRARIEERKCKRKDCSNLQKLLERRQVKDNYLKLQEDFSPFIKNWEFS
jgi:hypothetical protein